MTDREEGDEVASGIRVLLYLSNLSAMPIQTSTLGPASVPLLCFSVSPSLSR